DIRIVARDLEQRAGRQAAQARQRNGLGAEHVIIAGAEADEVAAVSEVDDLPAPILQRLIEAHGAVLDLIDVGDGVTLEEHVLAGLHDLGAVRRIQLSSPWLSLGVSELKWVASISWGRVMASMGHLC